MYNKAIEAAIKDMEEILNVLDKDACWKDKTICKIWEAVKLLLESQQNEGDRDVQQSNLDRSAGG